MVTNVPRCVSRRDVMAGFGALGALFAMGPRAWAQDKVVLGEGDHKYEWVPGWAKLPEGVTFSSTHGCAQPDSKDRIYVNTDNKNAIIVFENDGTYVKSLGQDLGGGNHGMQILKQGDAEVLYLAHLGRHEIVKMDLEGKVLMTIPWPEACGVYKNKNEYKPTMVAVAPSGDIFVGDGYGKSWLHRFNAKGEYAKSWNGKETKSGPLRTPHGVWVDQRGKQPLLAVADRSNGRIVWYDFDGGYVTETEKGLLRRPCKVFIQGDDVLIPDLKGRVTILGKDNKLIVHLGDNSNPGFRGNFGVKPADWKDGEFTAPHGACWDSKGNLYVEDWNKTGRVTKLKRLA